MQDESSTKIECILTRFFVGETAAILRDEIRVIEGKFNLK